MFEIGIIPNANISKLKSNQKMKIYKSAGEEFENEKKNKIQILCKVFNTQLTNFTNFEQL